MSRESSCLKVPQWLARSVQPVLLGVLLVASAAQAQQVWTGEELLTSGDWVEMSHANGTGGPRPYRVVGTSLLWERGAMNGCGPNNRQGRCIYERTFRLRLPATCVGPFKVSYHYTNQGSPDAPDFENDSDNDFMVGVGSATWMLINMTADNAQAELEYVTFTDLKDPAFNEFAFLASGPSIAPTVGGEVWMDATFDLSAGSSWSITATGFSTSYPTPSTVSATTTLAPPRGEAIYLFLVSGDRSEQYLFHSVALEGCATEGP